MAVLPDKHLLPCGKNLFKKLQKGFGLVDPAALKILATLCEASDRAQGCREVIDREGLTVTDRFGQVRPHPLLSSERDARAQVLQAFKVLGLEIEKENNDE